DFAQGGNPIPWNQPFSIQKTPKAITPLLIPKKILIRADMMSPVPINHLGLLLSPRKPFKNFDKPYINPCSVRKSPNSVFDMPRSASIAGIAIEIFFLTK